MAHILIIDDDEIISELASQTLLDAGHICGQVSSGPEALRLLRWRRPDLVLLDQNMPEMSGAQILREMRSSKDFYDLPVIMFTGISGEQDENTALYHGAQAYIRKPFKPDALVFECERVLAARGPEGGHLPLENHLRMRAGQTFAAPQFGRCNARYRPV